jgi:hypothetical protein
VPIDLDLETLMPCAFVCEGKDCRRDTAFSSLCEALESAQIRVETVKCLGVCSGPVLVAPVRGKPRVFHKIRGHQRRVRIIDALLSDDHRSVKALTPKKSKRSKAVRTVEKRLRRFTSARR